MSSSSDQQLHTLYWDLAELHCVGGRRSEAADHFALALYYARRMSNAERVEAARRRVVECSPQHLAAREVSAPLFFAQLLIRYPADEAAHSLGMMRRSTKTSASLEHSVGIMASTHVDDPFFSSHANAGLPQLDPLPDPFFDSRSPFDLGASSPIGHPVEPRVESDPSSPSRTRGGTIPPEFENHHLYDLGSSSPVIGSAADRIVDDYMKPEKIFTPPHSKETFAEPGFWGTVLNGLTFMTILIGMSSVGFFGYELYPRLVRLDGPTLVKHAQRHWKPVTTDGAFDPIDDSDAESENWAIAPPTMEPRIGMNDSDRRGSAPR
jgi:hypothetical protein